MVKQPPKNEQSGEDWQAKAEECLAGWQRTSADFANYKKRVEQEKSTWVQLALADSLLRIAPVLDDFRRAFAHIPPDQAESNWVHGMRQVEKRLRQIVTDAGLTPIDTSGAFDPAKHEATSYDHHDTVPDGEIIDCVETGWQHNDRVIKPAKVRVSRGADNERIANSE